MTTLEQLIASTNFDHSRNVASISRIIAAKYGYSAKDVTVIEQAALFHDVGKTTVPPDILNKPGSLTPEEFAIVKTHTEAGYALIMEVVKLLLVSSSVAKEHHERLDASGYLRMPACDISMYARLISIADVFDALVSRRSYKEAWDATSAVRYLIDNGNQFDREIVNCLVSVINEILFVYKTDTVRTEAE